MAVAADTTLGEVVRSTGGSLQTGPFGSQLHASDYQAEGTPLVMPFNMGDNVIRDVGVARVSSEDVKRLARHRLRAGDIVFSRRGDVGRRSIVRPENEGWLCGTGCLAAKFGPKRSDVNPMYLALLIGRPDIQAWLTDNAVGGTMPNLNTAILSSMPLRLPPRAQQDAVVQALEGIGELVTTLERSIAKKRDVKQGMMQELLTGRTRLPGFTREWCGETLGALAEVLGGGTPSTRAQSYWGGGIPWFTPAEIDEAGSGLVSYSRRSITPEGLRGSSANLLPEGTVLVTSRASLGHTAIAAVPVSTNQGFTSLVPKDARSSWFLYYWVQQNRFELESRAAGSTFLEISASKVADIPLNAPGIEERWAIGNVLQDADVEIEALEHRLDSARAVKVGMMQELLTGRTRLPVEEDT